MGTLISVLTKTMLTTFLTEKVVMRLMLELAKYLAGRSSNTLDNSLVEILTDAYNSK